MSSPFCKQFAVYLKTWNTITCSLCHIFLPSWPYARKMKICIWHVYAKQRFICALSTLVKPVWLWYSFPEVWNRKGTESGLVYIILDVLSKSQYADGQIFIKEKLLKNSLCRPFFLTLEKKERPKGFQFIVEMRLLKLSLIPALLRIASWPKLRSPCSAPSAPRPTPFATPAAGGQHWCTCPAPPCATSSPPISSSATPSLPPSAPAGPGSWTRSLGPRPLF